MIEIREVTGDDFDAAKAVEKEVFLLEGYPYNYDEFDEQSVMFGAFDGDRCIGALRLIKQSPKLPPVLADCQVWDVEEWISLGERFEEMGTHAVLPEYQKRNIGVELIKAAYTNGRIRGLTCMGVITEPDTAAHLNDILHFACRQIGEVGFHGWDCAPFIHVFDEVEQKVSEFDPGLYAWFVEGVPRELLSVQPIE